VAVCEIQEYILPTIYIKTNYYIQKMDVCSEMYNDV
jgi:hypothetical protein